MEGTIAPPTRYRPSAAPSDPRPRRFGNCSAGWSPGPSSQQDWVQRPRAGHSPQGLGSFFHYRPRPRGLEGEVESQDGIGDWERWGLAVGSGPKVKALTWGAWGGEGRPSEAGLETVFLAASSAPWCPKADATSCQARPWRQSRSPSMALSLGWFWEGGTLWIKAALLTQASQNLTEARDVSCHLPVPHPRGTVTFMAAKSKLELPEMTAPLNQTSGLHSF